MKMVVVTGAPRTGTTFVGKIIGYSHKANYIWEPFNCNYRQGIQDYYPYVGLGSNERKKELYTKLTDDLLSFKNLKAVIKPPRNRDGFLKVILKRIGINRTMLSYSMAKIKMILGQSDRLVAKDPVAVFLSRFLIENYNAKVVVCVRHPCAVALSRKRLGWGFDLSAWKNQDDLWVDYILNQIGPPPENGDQLALSAWHWKACYYHFIHLENDYPENLIFVRHEDICYRPAGEFKRIYDFLDLHWVTKIENKVMYYTTGNESEVRTPVSVIKRRDSKKLALGWKQHFTNNDVQRIREVTIPAGEYFYNENIFWDL